MQESNLQIYYGIIGSLSLVVAGSFNIPALFPIVIAVQMLYNNLGRQRSGESASGVIMKCNNKPLKFDYREN